MSMITKLQDLITRVGTEFKAIRTLIGGTGTSTVSALTTTATNLVGAINEVKVNADKTASTTTIPEGTNLYFTDTRADARVQNAAGTANGSPNGTAAPGVGTRWAREDHVHPNQRLDQLLAPTAAVAMGGQKITGLASGAAAGEAVQFGQLNAVATSGSASDLTTGTLPPAQLPAFTGHVTTNAGTSATTIANGVVTGPMMAAGAVVAHLGFTPENAANKGVANGYASLDSGGKVPAAQLPAFVDDVLEYANFAALPGTGETGKMYTTLDNGKIFRWGGSSYVEISGSPGSTDAVPEGSINLYYTNVRADARVQAAIDDAGAVAATKLYSSQKISTLLGTKLELGAAVTYTAPQIAQGQTNLNVPDLTKLGTDYETHDFVADFNAAIA